MMSTVHLFIWLAVAIPILLAYNAPPSATLLNQAFAWLGWGVAAVSLSFRYQISLLPQRAVRPKRWLVCGYSLIVFAALIAIQLGATIEISSAIAITGLAAIALSAIATRYERGTVALDNTACATLTGLLIAGGLSVATGLIQVFAPTLADGQWIASSFTGRAVGNLRQPNHLASLLLWSAIAAAWSFESARRSGTSGIVFGLLFVFLLLGIDLTASRTGLVGVLLLTIWGALDRRLSKPTRAGLLASPLIYLAIWLLVSAITIQGDTAFKGPERLHQADISSSRFAIWSNTLELIRQNPWTGVGVGNFNFAWTLTSFSSPRPTEFFDHSHNLPLQLLVELGVPLGTLVMALLLYAFWRAFRAAGEAKTDEEALAKRCLFMMVLMIGLHSLLEYPLWYAHFLFPTAFFWGLCLGSPAQTVAASVPRTGRMRRNWGLLLASAAIALGGVVMLVDYSRVVAIFAPGDNAAPLGERILRGRDSLFFAHHADYALVTTVDDPSRFIEEFKRPVHFLLDARLMMAWARALDGSGDRDRARWVAQRLREFQHPQTAEFFAVCDTPPAEQRSTPFQCEAPQRQYTFKDFQ